MKEVIIAGAGLSGLSAAYSLARGGYDVTIFEEDDVPGHDNNPYTCVLKNVNGRNTLDELKEFGIRIKAYEINPRVIKISPNTKKNIGFRYYHLLELGQSDESLENQMYLQCLAEGVNFKFNTKIHSADIVATGKNKKRFNIHGVGNVYRDMNLDPEATYLVYNNEIAPKGYVYISTRNGLSTVMAISFDSSLFSGMKERFKRGLEIFEPMRDMVKDATLVSEINGTAFYHENPYQNLQKGKTLYIGEAAGLQDAARGFGIRYAIISGALAAQSIIKKQDYTQLIKNYFKDEFQKNIERRRIHNKMTNKDYDKAISLG